MNRRITPSELQRIDVYDPGLVSGSRLVSPSEGSSGRDDEATAEGRAAESRRSKGGR